MKTLIVGAGGLKGILYLGGLKYIEEKGDLFSFDRYVGVSTGSVILSLVLSNFKVEDIYKHYINFNLEEISINPNKMIENYGYASTSTIEKYLEKLFIGKWGINPTFGQLYKFTGKELIIVVSNLTDNKPEYLSYQNQEDMLVTYAISLSISLPVVFFRKVIGNKIYIDGGFTDPIPIKKYDDGKTDIIAFYIEETSYIEPTDKHFSYIIACMNLLWKSFIHVKIEGCSSKVTLVPFEYNKLELLSLSLPNKYKTKMFDEGYLIVKKILDH